MISAALPFITVPVGVATADKSVINRFCPVEIRLEDGFLYVLVPKLGYSTKSGRIGCYMAEVEEGKLFNADVTHCVSDFDISAGIRIIQNNAELCEPIAAHIAANVNEKPTVYVTFVAHSKKIQYNAINVFLGVRKCKRT